MQHIHAELLRCESELRFLQSTEDRVAPQWDRFVAFFKALRGKAFDVSRISGGVAEREKIKSVLKEMGIVFDNEDRIMTIDWRVSKGGLFSRQYRDFKIIITYYPLLFDIRYTYYENGTFSERGVFCDKTALLWLMEKVFAQFEVDDPSGMAGRLVNAFYDFSNEVEHDPVVKAEWDRWRAFFLSLTAEKLNVDLIETTSDVKRDIQRLLSQIEITIDSAGLFVDVRWNTYARGCFMSFYYVSAHKKINSRLKTGSRNAFRGGRDVDDPRPVFNVVSTRKDLEIFMNELMTDVYNAETIRALGRTGPMEPFGWHLMRTFYKD
jgi:hypothetical protein